LAPRDLEKVFGQESVDEDMLPLRGGEEGTMRGTIVDEDMLPVVGAEKRKAEEREREREIQAHEKRREDEEKGWEDEEKRREDEEKGREAKEAEYVLKQEAMKEQFGGSFFKEVDPTKTHRRRHRHHQGRDSPRCSQDSSKIGSTSTGTGFRSSRIAESRAFGQYRESRWRDETEQMPASVNQPAPAAAQPEPALPSAKSRIKVHARVRPAAEASAAASTAASAPPARITVDHYAMSPVEHQMSASELFAALKAQGQAEQGPSAPFYSKWVPSSFKKASAGNNNKPTLEASYEEQTAKQDPPPFFFTAVTEAFYPEDSQCDDTIKKLAKKVAEAETAHNEQAARQKVKPIPKTKKEQRKAPAVAFFDALNKQFYSPTAPPADLESKEPFNGTGLAVDELADTEPKAFRSISAFMGEAGEEAGLQRVNQAMHQHQSQASPASSDGYNVDRLMSPISPGWSDIYRRAEEDKAAAVLQAAVRNALEKKAKAEMREVRRAMAAPPSVGVFVDPFADVAMQRPKHSSRYNSGSYVDWDSPVAEEMEEEEEKEAEKTDVVVVEQQQQQQREEEEEDKDEDDDDAEEEEEEKLKDNKDTEGVQEGRDEGWRVTQKGDNYLITYGIFFDSYRSSWAAAVFAPLEVFRMFVVGCATGMLVYKASTNAADVVSAASTAAEEAKGVLLEDVQGGIIFAVHAIQLLFEMVFRPETNRMESAINLVAMVAEFVPLVAAVVPVRGCGSLSVSTQLLILASALLGVVTRLLVLVTRLLRTMPLVFEIDCSMCTRAIGQTKGSGEKQTKGSGEKLDDQVTGLGAGWVEVEHADGNYYWHKASGVETYIHPNDEEPLNEAGLLNDEEPVGVPLSQVEGNQKPVGLCDLDLQLTTHDPPDQWQEHHDPHTGRPYYHNEQSGETVWVRPAGDRQQSAIAKNMSTVDMLHGPNVPRELEQMLGEGDTISLVELQKGAAVSAPAVVPSLNLLVDREQQTWERKMVPPALTMPARAFVPLQVPAPQALVAHNAPWVQRIDLPMPAPHVAAPEVPT
jgi:archaellum component FlaD/FlaE